MQWSLFFSVQKEILSNGSVEYFSVVIPTILEAEGNIYFCKNKCSCMLMETYLYTVRNLFTHWNRGSSVVILLLLFSMISGDSEHHRLFVGSAEPQGPRWLCFMVVLNWFISFFSLLLITCNLKETRTAKDLLDSSTVNIIYSTKQSGWWGNNIFSSVASPPPGPSAKKGIFVLLLQSTRLFAVSFALLHCTLFINTKLINYGHYHHLSISILRCHDFFVQFFCISQLCASLSEYCTVWFDAKDDVLPRRGTVHHWREPLSRYSPCSH